jgi:uncharacterized protein YndB with AHSA1/START domain
VRDTIIIEKNFNAPIKNVFAALITPEDLVQWHNAGDGWQTPYAEVDAQVGGLIKIAYADPEGNIVFDLTAVITELNEPHRLRYSMRGDVLSDEDERIVTYDLTEEDGITELRLEFDIENQNDKELQRNGWTTHIDNLEQLINMN